MFLVCFVVISQGMIRLGENEGTGKAQGHIRGRRRLTRIGLEQRQLRRERNTAARPTLSNRFSAMAIMAS